MDAFNEALERTVGNEGDYSDDPNDSGGKTRFGITEELARRYNYAGDMNALPYNIAVAIYRAEFWQSLRLGEVSVYSRRVALELFDTAVNIGPARTVNWLQRSLNVFNRKQSDYQDVTVDGDLGFNTLQSLRRFLELRGAKGEAALLKALNAFQGTYYIELAEAREKDESFVFGWMTNRVAI